MSEPQTQPSSNQPPKVWPRTPEGYCSCPYCTAIREGWIDAPKKDASA